MENELAFNVDRSSPVPLYYQVIQGVESAIRSGTLRPGCLLDSERKLATMLNLSLPTMRKAMDELVLSGRLVRKRGVGTQVASHSTSPLVLSSLYEELASSGKKPTTTVLSFIRQEADRDTLTKLQLSPGSGVYHFTRLRLAEGSPVALMENWVRDDLMTLKPEMLSSDGLYAVLRQGGVTFRLASQRIGASLTSACESSLLENEVGSPLITMERTVSDDAGQMIETGRHVYLADSYSFEMTLVQR